MRDLNQIQEDYFKFMKELKDKKQIMEENKLLEKLRDIGFLNEKVSKVSYGGIGLISISFTEIDRDTISIISRFKEYCPQHIPEIDLLLPKLYLNEEILEEMLKTIKTNGRK